MGCGKSYIGKRLAKSLGLSFIDLDDFIEEQEGRSIKEVFEKEGEAYFRRIEKEALRAMNQFDQTVIATGGGAPCFLDNSDWMKEYGITIYLQTPVEVIMKYLIRGRAKRPLLKGLDDEALQVFIQGKLKERESFYKNVHLIYERQIGGDEAVQELTQYFSMFDSLKK